MADVKISQLPAAASVATTDILPIVKLGTPNVTDKATIAQVRAAMMPVSLAADVSNVLGVGNGGTGLSALGTALYVVRVNAAGTALEFGAPASGSTVPTGTGYYHVTAGTADGAAVALTWTGDATGTGTGTSFALTVVKINGTSVPTGGTTGNTLAMTGVNTAGWQALNLAGGSNYVVNLLPLGNQAAPTGTGVVRATAGVWNGSASLITDADISAAAAIAASKLAPPGSTTQIIYNLSGAFAGSVNMTFDGNGIKLVSASAYLAYGATPAATGTIRASNGSSMRFRNAANTGDISVIETDASNNCFIGTDTAFTSANQAANLYLFGGVVSIGNGGATYLAINGVNISGGLPYIGNGSQYGMHGGIIVTMPASGADITLSSSQYCFDWIECAPGATPVANANVVLPLPATKDAAYYKTFFNSGSVNIKIKAGTAVIVKDCAAGFAQRYFIDNNGVHFAGPGGSGAWVPG